MGDNSNNYHSQGNASYDAHNRAGMEALMSAIDQQHRGLQQPGSAGYPMVANMQDQINAMIASSPGLGDAEKERLLAVAQQAAMYPNISASAFASGGQNHLWNSMNGMPFNLGMQHMPGLMPQTTIPGYTGLQNIPTDKTAAIRDAAANGLSYPGVNAMSPYLKMPGFPPVLPGSSVAGFLPSMGPLNPAALGALGAYSPFYPGLFPRLPHIPHVDQNSLLRIPMNSGVSTPPTQSRTPDAARTQSPLRGEKRPPSGGYHLKESLQRRLSAPNPTSNLHFRVPMRNDVSGTVDIRNGPSPYASYGRHRAPLPPQLVAPTNDPGKSRGHIDTKSIGQRISNLISENEKILCNPQLDRVKPRRVTRRNSLDTCTLTPSIPKHNPLTATLSAPRSLDKYSHSPASHERLENQNFLAVPGQNRARDSPEEVGLRLGGFTDARRVLGEPVSANQQLINPSHSSVGAFTEPQRREHRCPECGSVFSKMDTLDVHRKQYCSMRTNIAEPSDSSNLRQSVIQHTQSKSGDTPPPHPDPHKISKSPPIYCEVPTARNPVQDALRLMHKDLHRTKSADNAFLTKKTAAEFPNINVLPMATNELTPHNSDSNNESVQNELQINKSSIPTNKLPPKKKQLQLMRSNSANPSGREASKSPIRDASVPEPSTSAQAPMSQSPEPASFERTLQPPSSLHLNSAHTKKNLPPWIPLEDKPEGSSPTPFVGNPTRASPTQISGSPALATSPTRRKSPTSPISPTSRASPGRGSRSPSRSPTSNLESTIPRSNYKLLLHQLSLRNMQDMGYLSEAYHHSKDKDLKRNIASLLWSSSANDGSSKVPNMEELYPGKAKLARRLSPNGDLGLRTSTASNSSKAPLIQSHSRPHESSLEVHPTVTRSHSAGTTTDVNNNIKQYLQNKTRNQLLKQQQKSTAGPTKGHKPLTRTNANARYLLKSPTKDSTETSSGDNSGKMPLEARKSMGAIESSKKTKETLKRASSYQHESSQELQQKRQKLIPILSQSSSTSTMLPAPLVTASIPTDLPKKELPRMKSINPHTVQTPFLLHPHVSPSLGFEPHPTFCSLVSPQPMYVELKQSSVSMYSQWAVSEPMLPKGMTVMEIFKNTRLLKPLSPYISYNSVFTEPRKSQGYLNIVESKDYEKGKSKQSVNKTASPVEYGREKMDDTSAKNWAFSRMINTNLHSSGTCYTSCHNKFKHSHSASEAKRIKTSTSSVVKKFPKMCPPKVFIQPPSPDSTTLDGSSLDSPKSSEMIALEFSDCDTDDDVIQASCVHPITTNKLPPSASMTHCDLTIAKKSSDDQNLLVNVAGDNRVLRDPVPQQSKGPNSPKIGTVNNKDQPSSTYLTAGKVLSPRRLSEESGSNEEVKGQDADGSFKNHKKILKSRKERNASSPRAKRNADEKPATPNTLEDPTLAVHPIGACSEDPTKICALCRMKADDETGNHSEDGSEKSCKDELKPIADNSQRPSSPSTLPDISNATASPRARTPTPLSKNPAPLTVSVPKRNRDRSGSKSGSQPLTPGILDKARGSGMTQHWVTTTELQSSLPSPKQLEAMDDKPVEIANDTENQSSSPPFDSTECFTANPPNKNPVSELNFQKLSDSSPPPNGTTQNNGSLAAIVSGVMRSAAMQSQKKTKSSKTEMCELLSHSRPLIPTSELNGSTSKPIESETSNESSHTQENSLSSLAMLTSSVGPGHSKANMTLTVRTANDSEVFTSKANEGKAQITSDKSEVDIPRKFESVDSAEEDEVHCDGTKDELGEVEGESCNPRPHKCAECKVAFRIAGHLAKHLRSKGHDIAMQKKTLNRLKQQKLSSGQEVSSGGQSSISGSMNTTSHSPEPQPSEELLNQLGEAQVRALFEGNDEYTEISDAAAAEIAPEASDEERDGQASSSDPRPFKCIACKVAFRFQGHLDRHFRSNTHLLAVGHFERDVTSAIITNSDAHNEDNLGTREENNHNPEYNKSHHNKDIVANNEACDVINGVSKSPKPFVDLKDISTKTREVDQRLDETSVNQTSSNSDWPKSMSMKMNSISKFNGLNHNSSVIDSVSNLKSMKSPTLISPISPAKNQCYEVTPTLQEGPLPSTSPVPKIQQLSCSSPVAI